MLEGQVVNIDSVELLQFFYPDFQIKSELSMQDKDNKVIYAGGMKPKIKDYLEKRTKEYISTVGKMDRDLTGNHLVEFVYEKYNREVPKKTDEILGMLDDGEIKYASKIFWVTGKWIYSDNSEDVSMFDLFKSMSGSISEMVEVYIKLINKFPFYMVETSFFTFLQRMNDIEEQYISSYYKKILKRFKNKVSEDKINNSLMKYVKEDNMKEQIRFLMFLVDLR